VMIVIAPVIYVSCRGKRRSAVALSASSSDLWYNRERRQVHQCGYVRR
jgi:hypothetical protein